MDFSKQLLNYNSGSKGGLNVFLLTFLLLILNPPQLSYSNYIHLQIEVIPLWEPLNILPFKKYI